MIIDPPDWTPSEVAQQLKSLGLGQYGRNFLENDINGEALVCLQDSHLKEMGLKIIGHRLTLINFIRKLTKGEIKPIKNTQQPSLFASESEEEREPPRKGVDRIKPSVEDQSRKFPPNQGVAQKRMMAKGKSVAQESESESESESEADSYSEDKKPQQKVAIKGSGRVNESQQRAQRERYFNDAQEQSPPKAQLKGRTLPQYKSKSAAIQQRTTNPDDEEEDQPRSTKQSRQAQDSDSYDEDPVPQRPIQQKPQSKPIGRQQKPVQQSDSDSSDEQPIRQPAFRQKQQPKLVGRQQKPVQANESDSYDEEPVPQRSVQQKSQPKPAGRINPKRSVSPYDYTEEEQEEEAREQRESQPMPSPYLEGKLNLVECPYCLHKFGADRIAKHQQICAKSHNKKKKVFDARAQRLMGTGAEQYISKMDEETPEVPKDRDKYKREHQQLVETLRSAREYTAYENRKAAGKPVGPPPKMNISSQFDNDDRVSCPYCGRKFAREAAQRHIPVCERTKHMTAPRYGATKGRH